MDLEDPKHPTADDPHASKISPDDPRLRILPPPVDLGSFPVEMAWHVRYRHDPAHRWLRGLVGQVVGELGAPYRR